MDHQICKPLGIVFKSWLESGIFPIEWKKANVVPVHKKKSDSCFKPGDSCINQLLSITHGIYALFDKGYEVWGVFLDISNAFHKFWHEGFIFKLEKKKLENCYV